MPTPLDIEILMHYATRGDDFPRQDAPAVESAIIGFLRAGLLAPSDENDFANRRYKPTDGAHAYLRALTAVPLPERVWVVPGAAVGAMVEAWPPRVGEVERRAEQNAKNAALRRGLDALRAIPTAEVTVCPHDRTICPTPERCMDHACRRLAEDTAKSAEQRRKMTAPPKSIVDIPEQIDGVPLSFIRDLAESCRRSGLDPETFHLRHSKMFTGEVRDGVASHWQRVYAEIKREGR